MIGSPEEPLIIYKIWPTYDISSITNKLLKDGIQFINVQKIGSYRKNKSLPHIHVPFVLCTKIDALCFEDLDITEKKTFRNREEYLSILP